MTTAFDDQPLREIRALSIAQSQRAHRVRRAALLTAREAGASLADLAEAHGTSKQSISNMLRKARAERG